MTQPMMPPAYSVRPGQPSTSLLPGGVPGAPNVARVNTSTGSSAVLPGGASGASSSGVPAPLLNGVPGVSGISGARPPSSRRIQIKDPNTGKELDFLNTKFEAEDKSTPPGSSIQNRSATSPSPQLQQGAVSGVTSAGPVAGAPSSVPTTSVLVPAKNKAIPIRRPEDVKKEKEMEKELKERQEREEKEKLDREREEKERLRKEQDEAERIQKEREEAERLAKEREETERHKKELEEIKRLNEERELKEQEERDERERHAREEDERENERQETEKLEQKQKRESAEEKSIASKELNELDRKAVDSAGTEVTLASDEDGGYPIRPTLKNFKVGDDEDESSDVLKEGGPLLKDSATDPETARLSPEVEGGEDGRERVLIAELEDGEIVEEQEELEESQPRKPIVKISPTDFSKVAYPPGVKSPEYVSGVIKYDKTFLAYFQTLCVDRPDGLATKEEIFEDKKVGSAPTKSGSGAAGMRSIGGRPPSMVNVAPGRSATLPRMPSGTDVSMGSRPGSNLIPRSSQERFEQTIQRKATFGVGVQGVLDFIPPSGNRSGGFGPTTPLGRTGSGVGMSSMGRTPSSGNMRGGPAGGRGGGRGAGMPPRGNSRRGGNMPDESQFTIPLEQIKPLETSDSAWIPEALKRRPTAAELDQEAKEMLRLEELGRKIQGLLNKLTLENFDSVSSQILNMPLTGPDQLEVLVERIFDKAIDEPNFAGLYSKLCQKLYRDLPEKQSWIVGEDKSNAFRRFILNKNQKEYEAGNKWATIGKDRIKKDVSEMTQEEKDTIIAEEELKVKLKRRTLGNVVFIGELFKLSLLTEKIMHACITTLIKEVIDALKAASSGGPKASVEEDLETLIKLLTTAGEKLDHTKAHEHMETYFREIGHLSKNEAITSRIRFGLLDLIDLRKNKWVQRRQVAGPKTIAEIRAEVTAQQEQANMRSQGRSPSGRGAMVARESSQRGSLGREHSQRGSNDDRGVTTIYSKNQQVSKQTGDLSSFGKLGSESRKPAEVRLGPGPGALGMGFGAGAKGWNYGGDESEPRRSVPMSRTASLGASSVPTPVSNKFSALDEVAELKREDGKEEVKETEKSGAVEGPKELSEDQLASRASNVSKEILNGDVDGTAALETWEEFKFNKYEVKAVVDLLSQAFDAKSVTLASTRAADVISHIVNNGDRLLDQEGVMEALREITGLLDDMSYDIPHVYSAFGTVVARLVVGGAVPATVLAEISRSLLSSGGKVPVGTFQCEIFYLNMSSRSCDHRFFIGTAPKFIKEAFVTLKTIDSDEVTRHWTESGLTLQSFWPASTKSSDIQTWLDSNGFKFMNSTEEEKKVDVSKSRDPLMEQLKSGVSTRLKSDEDPTQIVQWISSDFPSDVISTPDFVRSLMTTFLRHLASRSILPDGAVEPVPATKERYLVEKTVVERVQPLLQAFLPEGRSDLRVAALFAVQAYCAELKFPADFLDHVFRQLHELEILDDQAYRDWREDTEHELASKKEALEHATFMKSIEDQ
ncbi:hypothetical protein HDU93_010044 [Gonapodya sp. JEL0774]|nr:hypothetical protein HDU93_010044 [Gonapodya sp. JEL0774]